MTDAIRTGIEGMGLEQFEELAVWAVDHCPVSDAVRRGVPVHDEVAEA